MKVLVTGVTGQLGFDVIRTLIRRDHSAIGTGRKKEFVSLIVDDVIEMLYYSLDITDRDQVNKVVGDLDPDAIIHCAAWTAVDDAEENTQIVNKVNVEGTKYLAEAAKAIDAKFVYISTDYVFDGTGEVPWQPDSSKLAPINTYGESKLAGEKQVTSILDKFFIVRISWVFGINGSNFVQTMLRAGKKYDKVTVVNDQIGIPTYSYDLARLLVDMIETEKYGVYHATNEGDYISWYDFTEEIYRQARLKTKVIPVTTEEYGLTKAKRPLNSRLDKTKLDSQKFKLLPHWKDGLRRYLLEYNKLEGGKHIGSN